MIVNIVRHRRKKKWVILHRQERYMHAINKVIDGKADPNYATLRWEKLQKARKNGK